MVPHVQIGDDMTVMQKVRTTANEFDNVHIFFASAEDLVNTIFKRGDGGHAKPAGGAALAAGEAGGGSAADAGVALDGLAVSSPDKAAPPAAVPKEVAPSSTPPAPLQHVPLPPAAHAAPSPPMPPPPAAVAAPAQAMRRAEERAREHEFSSSADAPFCKACTSLNIMRIMGQKVCVKCAKCKEHAGAYCTH